MKFSFITALLFSMSTAGACPNLSGTFMCQDSSDESSGPYIQIISQQTENGVTTYTVGDGEDVETVIADGVARSVKDVDQDPDGTTTTYIYTSVWTCSNSQLKGNIVIDVDPNPLNLFGTVSLTSSLTADGDLKTLIITAIKDSNSNVIDGEVREEICTRE